MRVAWLLVLAACSDKSSSSKEPLGVLRDTKQAWLYELVSGTSIDALAPVAGAPQAKCKIAKWETFTGSKTRERSKIDCSPRERIADPNGFGGAFYQQKFLVFDRDAVRELPSTEDGQGFAVGFTFPSKLDGSTWTYDRTAKMRDVHSKVDVRADTMSVLGESRPVWISSSTYTWSDKEPAQLGAAIFAPGVAPVLLCEHEEGTYWCLRLAGTAEAKRPPGKLVAKLPTKKERADLVKMLTTMDRVPDLYYDVMAGRLAVRDDLPITSGEYGPSVELDTNQLRLGADVLDLTTFGERLAGIATKLEEEIASARFPRSMDPVQARERINVLVDAATPWQRVHEVLEAAARAGFRQPVFVFARTPSTPPPPRTWVEDAAKEAARENDAAKFLGELTKKILEDCESLRAAFAVDGSGNAAEQLIQQLAAEIPKAPCLYDLPALRSVLWATLGTPYPHSVIILEIDPTGERVDLPATTLWRDASKQLRPDMSLAL